jgi:ethanolaminephosphotransferase
MSFRSLLKMFSSYRLRMASLTFANLLIPVAVLVFAAGFFPYKPVLPGLASWEDGGDSGRPYDLEAHAPFNKVIFMVVDALRSDFVFGESSAMGFVQRCACLHA